MTFDPTEKHFSVRSKPVVEPPVEEAAPSLEEERKGPGVKEERGGPGVEEEREGPGVSRDN